jgi:hypothetical protein
MDDPSSELRRAAVQSAIDQAKSEAISGKKDKALALYRRAISSARDLDQVNTIDKQLKDLGETIDLPKHFGFVTRWKLIGPFDNTDRRGLDTVYPPEKELDAAAGYDGPFGQVQWKSHTSTDRYGLVDLNAVLGTRKQVTAYAWAELTSPREQDVEFRWSTYNANKLWLNGRLLAENAIYHAGERFDQYRAFGTLKTGNNMLLLKICQNEQTQTWARYWQFKLRVCDDHGTAVGLTEDLDNRDDQQ